MMPIDLTLTVTLTVEEAHFLYDSVEAAAEVHVGSERADLADRVAEKVTTAIATVVQAKGIRLDGLRPCECEHAVHGNVFTDILSPRPVRPPQEHRLRDSTTTTVFRDVKTPYGTFGLCQACVEAGHMQEATP
jgi:hypothetical protein